jgi:hypothetical protein
MLLSHPKFGRDSILGQYIITGCLKDFDKNLDCNFLFD